MDPNLDPVHMLAGVSVQYVCSQPFTGGRCVNPAPTLPRSEMEQWAPALSYAYENEQITVLKRLENEGMDIAAHNATLVFLQTMKRIG